MTKLDTRLHAYKPTRADITLKGKVEAEYFVVGQKMQVKVPVLNIHKGPSREAMQVTQALIGETVSVFETEHGWAWLQLKNDGFVGYAEMSKLGSNVFETTHHVAVLSTTHYPKPDLKSQPVKHLSLQSALSVNGVDGDYAILATGGYVFADHLRAISQPLPDYVSVAGLFLGTPYLWGGKSVAGLDCSGLVQVASQAAGKVCPRDSDMQEQALGTQWPTDDVGNLQRGDLVFWDGHVGIMTNATDLLHANAYHMMVMIEPLSEAIARIGKTGKPVTSIRRIQ
jgi:cell wall-associated NlpC family hydrolase